MQIIINPSTDAFPILSAKEITQLWNSLPPLPDKPIPHTHFHCPIECIGRGAKSEPKSWVELSRVEKFKKKYSKQNWLSEILGLT